MRILLCHNQYQLAGGEDTVVDAELQLLQSASHEVTLHLVSNDAIQTLPQKIRAGLQVSYSREAKAAMHKLLEQHQPDVVHFHNIFPLLTPSVYEACHERNIATVQTLHNYRNICPGALLMRNNKVCELCVTGSPYHAVVHGCYRGSRLQSLPVAHMVSRHRHQGSWHHLVDRFIALTDFARNKFIEAGFPADKIAIKPNFIAPPTEDGYTERENFALFIGRLSEEKGIRTLCEAFDGLATPLIIAGDGPLAGELKQPAATNIRFLGRQNREQVYDLMRRARVLIMPSVWYEGFPMVLVEAFAHGLPVICSRLGGMQEVVQDGVHGLHFTAGSSMDLREKVQAFYADDALTARMRENTRETFLSRYTPEINYRILMNIYQEAIDARKR